MTACATRANSSTPASRTIFVGTAPSSAASEMVGTSVGTSDVGPSVGGNDGVTVEGGVSGTGVGTLLGSFVGSVVGSSDGCSVGDAVDNAVGGAVGSAVGSSVGSTVGNSVGRSEGNSVGIPVGRADGSSDGYHVGPRDGPGVADGKMPRVGIADGWTVAPSCPSGGQLVPPLEGAAMIALERVRLLRASQASHSSQLSQEETTQSTGQAPRLHAESSRASSQKVPSRVDRLRYRTPVSQVVEQTDHCCSTMLYKSRMSRERETGRAPPMRRSDSCLHWMRPAV
jgi:hypothetical protein